MDGTLASLNKNSMVKAELERTVFVAHWNSAEVTTIEDFCRVANEDERLSFKSTDNPTKDHQRARQLALRHILGNIDRNDPNAKPNFGAPYAQFIQRRKDQSAKLHIRQLPKTASNSHLDFGQKDFEAVLPNFKPVEW